MDEKKKKRRKNCHLNTYFINLIFFLTASAYHRLYLAIRKQILLDQGLDSYMAIDIYFKAGYCKSFSQKRGPITHGSHATSKSCIARFRINRLFILTTALKTSHDSFNLLINFIKYTNIIHNKLVPGEEH